MPLDIDRLNQQLAQLEEYISQLRTLESKPQTEFTAYSLTEAAAERLIYKAIQCALDIAQHLGNNLGFGPPRFYKDLFVHLGEHHVIPPALQKRLENMAGMRNVLAHEYARVDPAKIYHVIAQDYKDLVLFAKHIASYLKTAKTTPDNSKYNLR